MNKNKVLGSVLIATGVCCIGTMAYLHFDAEKKLNDELKNRLVYSSVDSGTTDSSHSDLPEAVEFSPVQEDMKVAEVKTFTNVLEIPSCEITVPLVEGVSQESLMRGAGHFPETPSIGETGNACYAGHYSTIYSCIFNNLPNIKIYDEVVGYDAKGNKTVYTVIGKYITTPDNVGVLGQQEGVKDLTLVTCTENGLMRLIVSCRELSKEELKEYKKESEKEKRSSMYAINDSIGEVSISDYFNKQDNEMEKSKSIDTYKSSYITDTKTEEILRREK